MGWYRSDGSRDDAGSWVWGSVSQITLGFLVLGYIEARIRCYNLCDAKYTLRSKIDIEVNLVYCSVSKIEKNDKEKQNHDAIAYLSVTSFIAMPQITQSADQSSTSRALHCKNIRTSTE